MERRLARLRARASVEALCSRIFVVCCSQVPFKGHVLGLLAPVLQLFLTDYRFAV